MQKIKTDLKTKAFKKAYLFTGAETYLIDYYAKELIRLSVEEGTEEFNLLKITPPLPEDSEIDGFINAYPFMSERKILYIRNSGLLKKSTDEQKTFWSDVISNIPEYATVLFAESEVDKRNAIYKQIAKNGSVCEFPYQAPTELSPWAVKIFKSNEKIIDSKTAFYLAEQCGQGMQNLKNEIDKLLSYAKDKSEITVSDIDAVIAKNAENQVFAMIDDIVEGKNEEAYKKLNDLKALGEEPIKIISIIFNKYSTYKKVSILKNKPVSEISLLCGLYDKYTKKYLNQLNKLSTKKIEEIMSLCTKTDFDIKNGNTDKWLAVELIISQAIK